jgi:phage terminase large subunit-like protein
VLPIDPGQAGVARGNDMKRKLAEMGINCMLVRPSKSKRVRFLPFSAIAEAGYVHVVRADWNEELFHECEEFTGLKRGERDDICDSLSDSILALNKGYDIPDFSLPNLSGSPFPVTLPSYSGSIQNYTGAATTALPSFNL